jgi:(1->4)-alpha-D-glucan 1-alpha-D-glucosylmutase
MMSDHVKPNLPYEQACNEFIEQLLNPNHDFIPSLLPFLRKIIHYANIYSMVQVIIKMTAPGIPDIYQGCELWDLSYVDPDNRRPVDFNLRRNLLNQLKEKEQESISSLLEWATKNYEKGTQKLLVTEKLLQLRRANNDLFCSGDYMPVYSEGSDRVIIAFLRKYDDKWLLVVLPVGIVSNESKDLQLILPADAPSVWQNIFTGEIINGHSISVKTVFAHFPVAVLKQIQGL